MRLLPSLVLITAIGCAKPADLGGIDAGSSGSTADGAIDADAPGDAASSGSGLSAMAELAYIKSSSPGQDNLFGYTVVLSADGSTLVVGAPQMNGAIAPQGPGGGVVFVFVRADGTWVQQAYLQGSNAHVFGNTLALSADGSTLAVGDYEDASSATGVNPTHTDDYDPDSGAVYVFVRSGVTWSQQVYLKGADTQLYDRFGELVSLSADGATLAVGAPGESSDAAGVDGNQLDNNLVDAGAAYVFTRAGSTWTQDAYIKASNTGAGDNFGTVALSGDGSTLAVGAPGEASAATGIGGDELDDSAAGAGAVYVFSRAPDTWTQQAYIKASNTDAGDDFSIVALSSDGSTLAVSAPHEASAATGIDGDQSDNSAMSAGAAYVFVRSAGSWTQQAYVKASNTDAGDMFGASLGLSSDGKTLAIGADLESSAATGIDGDQADNSASGAGAAYVFVRSSAGWSQAHYVKASNTDSEDEFGASCALSGDASTFVVSGILEDSAAAGIDGNQADNSMTNAGAAYVFGPPSQME